MLKTTLSAAVSIAGVALALSACGNSGSSDTAQEQTAGATPSQAQQSTAPGSATAPVAPKVLSLAGLKKALLPVTDLPAGYADDGAYDNGPGGHTFCNYKAPTPAVAYGRYYASGGGIATQEVVLNIRQFKSSAAALGAVNKIETTVAKCHSETYDGSKLNYSAMSAPQAGEKAIGVRISESGATGLDYFVVVGAAEIQVGSSGMTNVDPSMLLALVSKQANRYQAAIQ